LTATGGRILWHGGRTAWCSLRTVDSSRQSDGKTDCVQGLGRD
jgi:hypothetical protein